MLPPPLGDERSYLCISRNSRRLRRRGSRSIETLIRRTSEVLRTCPLNETSEESREGSLPDIIQMQTLNILKINIPKKPKKWSLISHFYYLKKQT